MTKKIVFVSMLFISLFSISSNAQMNAKFGVKAGANISTFLGNDAPSADGLVAPHFGGLAHISFGENENGVSDYIIQPELVFSVLGGKESEGKTVLSYVQVPIMIQRYILSSGFYLETGPQIGFLLGAKSKINGNSIDIKDQTKSIDFMLNFGLGYKLNSGIGINARYGLGVGSIAKNSDVHNATISAGLFYVFGNSEE